MIDVVDTADSSRRSEVSVAAITQSSLKMARRDRFGAWAALNAEALATARRIDATDGDLPLRGITVGIKDVFAVEGLPRRAGSALTPEAASKADAATVHRLRALGAVVIGTTRMPEFALGPTPRAVNPHDVRRSPGSSSSGSAIAVAAGQVSLALAAQTNASIIRPASFCGVTALKPTQGALPVEGMLRLVPTLDQPGLIAPGVASLARVWRAWQGGGEARPRLGPSTFALVRTARWDRCEPVAREAVENLARSVHADELELPTEFDSAWDWMDTIISVELAENLDMYSDRFERLTKPIQRAILKGRATSRTRYREALDGRLALRKWADTSLSSVDAVITPAAAGPAPFLEAGTGLPDFSTLWSLAGAPCLTFPITVDGDGMPIGVQLVAARGRDEHLLAVASELYADDFLQHLTHGQQPRHQPVPSNLHGTEHLFNGARR